MLARLAPLTAAVLTTMGSTAGAQTQDAIAVLQAAETAYHASETIRAEFTQTIVNPMLGPPESSTGVLFLAPPDRFAMRFDDPEGDRIVADGTWLWLFTPSTVPDQVIRQPVPESGPATPNLFAQFVDRPLERYNAAYVGPAVVQEREVERVRLVPKVDGLPFREALLYVSDDGLLRKLDLVEDTGQRRSFLFETVKVNVAIADAELRFDPPKGVRVITP
jgi:outer membrane lipoprotein carrier protein